jgi:hypothetical protein
MNRSVFSGAFVAAVAAGALSFMAMPQPASARGLGDAGELEHARANARAGGPVSERDAELLDRYGCLSGTRSAFCQRQKSEKRYYRRAQQRQNGRY